MQQGIKSFCEIALQGPTSLLSISVTSFVVDEGGVYSSRLDRRNLAAEGRDCVQGRPENGKRAEWRVGSSVVGSGATAGGEKVEPPAQSTRHAQGRETWLGRGALRSCLR